MKLPIALAQSYDSLNTADINPIGAISKTDLKKFIAYARDAFDLPILTKYANIHTIYTHVKAQRLPRFCVEPPLSSAS